jgi:hypothetical protein
MQIRCDRALCGLSVDFQVTYVHYLDTVPVRHVVLLRDIRHDSSITTQIWGRACLAAWNPCCQRSPLFFNLPFCHLPRIRCWDLLFGLAVRTRCLGSLSWLAVCGLEMVCLPLRIIHTHHSLLREREKRLASNLFSRSGVLSTDARAVVCLRVVLCLAGFRTARPSGGRARRKRLARFRVLSLSLLRVLHKRLDRSPAGSVHEEWL